MKIQGKILDYSDETPLQGASIVVTDQYGKPTGAGATANENGTFTIESNQLDNPYNKVAISFVGYNTETMQPASAIGDIFLTREGQTLDAVIVTAKRISKEVLTLRFALVVLFVVLFIYLSSKYFKS
jgi:hypothetical protein